MTSKSFWFEYCPVFQFVILPFHRMKRLGAYGCKLNNGAQTNARKFFHRPHFMKVREKTTEDGLWQVTYTHMMG